MRSLLYNIAFYLIVPTYLILGAPMLLGSRRQAVRGIYGGISSALLWTLKAIVGLETDARGLENLRKGPVIVAVKHQSTWDVFALTNYFDEPAVILKSELMKIPFFRLVRHKNGYDPRAPRQGQGGHQAIGQGCPYPGRSGP